MTLEPRSMHDMTGWHRLTCDQADIIAERHRGLEPLKVTSTLTDLQGRFGPPVIFTEWWWRGMPLLREYRDNLSECRHYGAMDATAAATRDDGEDES